MSNPRYFLVCTESQLSTMFESGWVDLIEGAKQCGITIIDREKDDDRQFWRILSSRRKATDLRKVEEEANSRNVERELAYDGEFEGDDKWEGVGNRLDPVEADEVEHHDRDCGDTGGDI